MRSLLLSIFLFCFCQSAWSTHLKGGHINIRQLNGLNYIIELNLWTNTGNSVEPNPGNLLVNGQSVIPNLESSIEGDFIEVGNETAYWTFSTMYSFSAPGTYEVVYEEFNRDAGIINVPNSVDIPFVIKTSVKVDPILSINAIPKPGPFTWSNAISGSDYFYYPAFKDPDGDSLSFHSAIPLSSSDTHVEGYQFLNQYSDSYYLSPYTGEIQWLSPNRVGKFLHSMIVREWRKVGGNYTIISESQFDMQLHLEESNDNSENVEIAFDVNNCVSASETVGIMVNGSPSTNQIFISTNYPGSILLNGEAVSSNGIALDYEDDLELKVDFVETLQSSSIFSLLQVSVVDTSSHLVGSRALVVTADCAALPSAIVTGLRVEERKFFNVYPNPAKGCFSVDLSSWSGQAVQVQLYNSIGKEVYWDKLIADDNALRFAVAGLPRGVYILNLVHDKKQHTQRIVLD